MLFVVVDLVFGQAQHMGPVFGLAPAAVKSHGFLHVVSVPERQAGRAAQFSTFGSQEPNPRGRAPRRTSTHLQRCHPILLLLTHRQAAASPVPNM